MLGFTGQEEPPLDASIPTGAELWCVRDAICQLMGWPPGSEDYDAFIPLIGTQNMRRLAAHLGLTMFDSDNATELTDEVLAHPGVVEYDLEVPGVPDGDALAHMIYVPDLRGLGVPQLPPEYDQCNPQLSGFLVDMTQPPSAR
jgi:hypothetical protein